MRSCAVLRRGDMPDGLSWEIQGRVYYAPRAGSGDMHFRMMVVKQRGEVVAWTEPGYGEPQRPEQMPTPRGLLIRLPVAPVTGSVTPLDEVWLRREPLRNWVHLDARAWRAEAQARLAPGEALSPTYQLEIRPLRATGVVTRGPGQTSVGSYTAWLDLGEDRLVLIGFSRN
ncbi:hypothetical protein [Sediminicoccus sp. BL-A-41-H5]|uniref:hypothetical protein n=1 Tax=Sediminicoccus sp. BL-A-41-H5 TaxID=3421106 RepID=UPI003D67EBF6